MYKIFSIHYDSPNPDNDIHFQHIASILKSSDQRWREILRSGSMIIWELPDTLGTMCSYNLEYESGVIAGHLFTKTPNQILRNSLINNNQKHTPIDTYDIVSSKGNVLIDDFWGSYIAFIQDKSINSWHVIRSPMGTLSCFRFKIDKATVLTSCPEILADICGSQLQPNWSAAALALKYVYLLNERTAIDGVLSLQSGQRLTLQYDTEKISRIWKPENIAQNSSDSNLQDTMELLRQTVLDCCQTWLSAQPNGLITLSGGFDSSLIAGCISAANIPSNIACITYYHDSPLIDEREFARLTAQKNRLPLIEHELTSEDVNLDFYNQLRKIPWPVRPVYEAERGRVESDIAKAYGLGASFTGSGGDGVFFAMEENLAAQDYARSNNISSQFFKFALLSARLSNTTFWHTLASMIRIRYNSSNSCHDKLPKNDWEYWGINRDIINSNLFKIDIAPWSHLTDLHILPGKRSQLDTLATPNYYPVLRTSDFLETICPFLSQPIVEVCLSIPSYILQFNGRERGLARIVFSDLICPEVNERRFKSHFSDYSHSMIINNKEFYKDFLLSGVLIKNNILNRNEIDHGLSTDNLTFEKYSRIMQFADVEAWARAWI